MLGIIAELATSQTGSNLEPQHSQFLFNMNPLISCAQSKYIFLQRECALAHLTKDLSYVMLW